MPYLCIAQIKKNQKMKKLLVLTMMLVACFSMANAQQNDKKMAEIKFDATTYDFGSFTESDAIQTTVFTFTNVGEAPLIINQAIASCGCTVPTYTKKPVMPGQKGEIKVTYNGKGKFFGQFKKSITVRTNGATEMTRLYITGNMTEDKK